MGMNINKGDNSSDNNSVDTFDDMTFDDMTLDDEPVQVEFDDSFEENEQSNSNKNLSIKKQDTTVEKTDEQEKTDKQEEASKAEKDKSSSTQKSDKAVKNSVNTKKSNKENKKNAKQAKKDAEEAKKKAKQAKKQKQKETKKAEKKKKNKFVTLLKVVFTIIVIFAVAIKVLSMNGIKNADKHITVADSAPISTESTETFGSLDANDSDVENTTESSNSEVVSNGASDGTLIELNKPVNVAVTVNTKLEGETEYTDHTGYLNFEYSNFISGYDNVSKYVDEYNENSTNKINLPSKEDMKNSSVESTLVMYEVKVTVPDDFPTNDVKHGFTGLKPTFMFNILGTESGDKLVHENYEFEIPEAYFIGDDTSEFIIGNTYTLRYMATMPVGLTSDEYNIELTYTNNDETDTYKLQSVDIPSDAE